MADCVATGVPPCHREDEESTVMSWVLFNPDAEGAEITTELPIEPIWFGVIAMGALLALLLVTFAFRSVHTRH